MPLTAGARLGAFEVRSLLGAGGMGEVYRAHDTELGREVALKILSPAVSDADGLARFEREARILAALNHRNIAAIYGVASDGSTRALVLELIEGETLAELIERGPLAIERALKIADQIAEALEAAHERSIVHRDLKPANVKVTGAGTVKVLDFGIAKALAADSDASTIESHHTRTGVVIGTRAYMSPEQTRALPVDKRADVWAFGCVLYEMLTGRRAFAGATAADITTAVLEREPDWTALPPATPESIRRLLRRTLDKDPQRRLRDIADARIDLEDGLRSPSGERRESSPSARSSGTASWRVHAAWGAAMLALLAIGASRLAPWSTPADVVTTHVTMPLPGPFAEAFPRLAVSADGWKIAIASTSGITIRDRREQEPRLLSGTAQSTTPFFSPDGAWVGFHSDGRLRKVPVDGGQPITIADIAAAQRGFTWIADGAIVFGHTNSVLSMIPAEGGAPKAITTLDRTRDETSHRWPHAISGRRVLLYAAGSSVSSNEWNSAHIVAQSLDTGERRVIAERGSMPGYGDGHVFYLSGRSLLAQRFDPDRLAVSGPVITVLADVMRAVSGAGMYAVSLDGTLAAVRRAPPVPRRLVWSDRDGRITPLPLAAAFYSVPRLSPDGQRVAVTISDPDSDVWVYDVVRGSGTRLTNDGKSMWPIWTPDATELVYSSTRGGPALLRRIGANGDGGERLLLENTLINRALTWNAKGELIFLQVRDTAGLVTLQGGSEQRPLNASRADADQGRVSPDGKWLAYRSPESGRSEVYVRPLAGGDRRQISRDGGLLGIWSHDSRELFIRTAAWEISSVSVSASGVFGEPRRLFTPSLPIADQLFDVAPDGRFLFVVEEQTQPSADQLQLTFNVGADLRRRADSQ